MIRYISDASEIVKPVSSRLSLEIEDQVINLRIMLT